MWSPLDIYKCWLFGITTLVHFCFPFFYDLCSPKFGQFRRRLFAETQTAAEWFCVCLNGRSKETCRRWTTCLWATQHGGVPINTKRVWSRRLIETSWGRPFRQAKNRERICVRRTPPRNCSNVVVHKNQVKRIPLTNSAIPSKIARNIDVSRGII